MTSPRLEISAPRCSALLIGWESHANSGGPALRQLCEREIRTQRQAVAIARAALPPASPRFLRAVGDLVVKGNLSGHTPPGAIGTSWVARATAFIPTYRPTLNLYRKTRKTSAPAPARLRHDVDSFISQASAAMLIGDVVRELLRATRSVERDFSLGRARAVYVRK